MELIERSGYLDILHKQLKQTARGEGFIFFLIGEAGIGKTSLVKAFIREVEDDCQVYTGTCDSLFTPRPLAPLFDIAYQIGGELPALLQSTTDKSTLFTAFLQKFNSSSAPFVLVFEDIHWADEATLDFIKFLSRRISRSKCLFVLTFRDNEISENQALRNVLADLSPDVMQKITLPPLSRQAVKEMAAIKGYSGEDVYNISGGIPFYVNEILASYSPGIPRNIKDAVLAIYQRTVGIKKELWELFAVAPQGIEIDLLEKITPHYSDCLDQCISNGYLLTDKNKIRYKHELYRRTVEESISPLKRIDLHKKVLDLLLHSNETFRSERIVHHAKNANAYEVVMKYAPLAAEQAVQMGAHVEASKLYLTAIEYAPRSNPNELVHLYEQYSYECYLTNQIKEAIIYQQRALRVWKEKNETEKTGNSLRILSRLWWFEANRRESEKLGHEAITILENEPVSAVKAMAYSNMSQLKMLADEHEDSIYWGEEAISMAKELGDNEILSHALCNVGTIKMRRSEYKEGEAILLESLRIAMQNGYHEQVGRTYTNLGSNAVLIKRYDVASRYLDEGISFCEERDIDSWSKYMLAWKARLLTETGRWTEATEVCERLAHNEANSAVIRVGALYLLGKIKLRSGHDDALDYLEKAKALAFPAGELQRIAPIMVALLEYEWHTGKQVIPEAELNNVIQLIKESDNRLHYSEFAYWLEKARDMIIYENDLFKPYQLEVEGQGHAAAAEWKKIGCPYEEAHALFTGDDDDKRNALTILTNLGATATHEKMKQEMRTAGIRHIPRGLRETTKANPAQLTTRQVDVLKLLHAGLQNKEIAGKLFISAKTVDHHISAILFKLDVNSRTRAVSEAIRLGIIK